MNSQRLQVPEVNPKYSFPVPKPAQIRINRGTGFEVSFEYTDRHSNYKWPSDPAANYLVCSWIYKLSQDYDLDSLFNYKIDGYQDFAHHQVSIETFHHLPKKLIGEWKENLDFDELLAHPIFSLRFCYKENSSERLIGIPRNGVFYILWWDPNHTIYGVPLNLDTQKCERLDCVHLNFDVSLTHNPGD
jgi:hypothetical protein